MGAADQRFATGDLPGLRDKNGMIGIKLHECVEIFRSYRFVSC